jgi:predicted nucleic acid-binding Zn ribbon protein
MMKWLALIKPTMIKPAPTKLDEAQQGETVQDDLSEDPKRIARRAMLRRFLIALLLASPSIGSWFSSNFVYARFDDAQQPVKTEMAGLRTDMADLERFVALFQANELSRGTFALLMAAVSADTKLRYLGDNLYRANSTSIGALRRAAAIVYPERWQATLKPYEEIVAQGYDSPETVQRLTDFENKVVADALSRITRDQARLNTLAETLEGYERRRQRVASALTYLAVALSIFLFAFQLRSSK